MAGDWNGDGTDTVGIYRRLDATFRLRDEAGKTSARSRSVRPATRTWCRWLATGTATGATASGCTGGPTPRSWCATTSGGRCRASDSGSPGAADVLPVVGDWDGDGRDSFGLYRAGDGHVPPAQRVRRRPSPRRLRHPRGCRGAGGRRLGRRWPRHRRHLPAGDGHVRAREAPTRRCPPEGPPPSRPAHQPAADLLPLAGDWNGLDLVTLDDLDAIFGPFADEAAVEAQLPAAERSHAPGSGPPPPPARPRSWRPSTTRATSGPTPSRRATPPRTEAAASSSSPATSTTARGSRSRLGPGSRTRPRRHPHDQRPGRRLVLDRGPRHQPRRRPLDMAAVNIAVGFRPSVREDTERCGDFIRALKWFSGGELSRDVNCERSVTSQLLAWASILGSGAGGSSTGGQVSTDAPDTGGVAAGGTAVPRRAGDRTTIGPTRPPTTTRPTSPPATTTPTTRPATPGSTRPRRRARPRPRRRRRSTTTTAPTTSTDDHDGAVRSHYDAPAARPRRAPPPRHPTPCPTTTTTTAPTSTAPPSSSSSTGSTGSSSLLDVVVGRRLTMGRRRAGSISPRRS